MRLRGRGIILISILVLTLLATFFVGALLQMNPTRLRRTVQDQHQDNALAAARAGVEYALARLAQDQSWRGEGEGLTVRSDHLVVREDRGNVWGWLRADSGEWSAFRLRFNYQDGDPGLDGLPDPVTPIPSANISFNNLEGASSLLIPLGTGANFDFTGERGFSVPERSVALVVEGMVGDGVSPDVPAPTGDGLVVSRTLEGIYQISNFADGAPDGAVLQAGGDSAFMLGSGTGVSDEDFSGFLRLAASEQTALMRTKGRSLIGQAPGKASPFNFYPDMHSEVRVGRPGFTPNTKAGQEFTNTSEEANAALLEVEWDKVADSDQPGRLRLPAGVYTISGAGSPDGERVHYYPMTFAEYRETLVAGGTPASSEVPAEFLDRVDFDAPVAAGETRDTITFERDVEVTAVGSVKDFTVVPASGAKQKSESTFTSAVTPGRFDQVSIPDQAETGNALLGFILSFGAPDLHFEAPGVVYQNGDFTTGGPAQLARAALAQQTFTFHSPVPNLPGAVQAVAGAAGVAMGGGGGGGGQLLAGGGGGPYANPVGGGPVAFTVSNPGRLLAAASTFGSIPDTVLQTDVDPLEVPSSAVADDTVPQDIEVRFAPEGGESAVIRSGGDVMLGTHVSGKGGAIVAEGDIDLVGLGVDLQAGQGERDGVSLYSKGDINISTYDERRNKFWDASIKGVIFAKGNLTLRLGEVVRSGKEPAWGKFDLLGSVIVLGDAPSVIGTPTGGPGGQGLFNAPESALESLFAAETEGGNCAVIAEGVRLFYEPKFLAPYVDTEGFLPTFSPVSVVER